ncbi:MAG TPA: hypothetical protein VHW25_05995 [Steroidobacteraceae bacterium]|nr:hypothetical protein [Steroidobacteraceae bacterium]
MLTAALAACGGGDAPFVGSGSGSTGTGSTGSTGGTTGGNGGTTVTASALSVSTSAPTIPADGSSSATITALAKNDDNNLISGVQVCFKASSGGVAVTNGTNGCVSTGANGSAVATLSTAGDSSLRTITVTATAGSQVGTASVQVVASSQSGTTTVQLGNGNGSTFVAGAIGVGAPTLSAGGTTALNVSVVDQTGTLYNAGPVTVTFNSPCVATGQATILSTVTGTGAPPAGTVVTTTGFAAATYTAMGCSGPDTITASATVGTQNLAATGTVTVGAASIGSIQFVSASQTSIGLKGTGLNQTSTVVFKVLNSTGGPFQGVAVTFTPNTTVGGLAISPTTATSASDGTVQTTVSSGTVHTTVRVTASIAAPALSTQSSQLTVTTGLPTSSSFSSAVGPAKYANGVSPLSCPNVEAYSIDGVTVPITVFLSDRYSNPVPDGTAVAFTTNGGQIGGNCNTLGGTCFVTWTSTNPRPTTQLASVTGVPPSNGYGRATILATAIGEESFDDANGNGFYDSTESFANLGEPYRDDNENGAYDTGEYFLDFNGNGARDLPSGQFVGITCTGTAPGSTCMQSTLALGVSHLLTMSTSDALITLDAADTAGLTNSGTVAAPMLAMPISSSAQLVVNVQDTSGVGHGIPGNSMAAGTTVSFQSSSTTVVVAAVGSTTVGCDATVGGQNYGAALTTTTTTGSATITVKVTSPSGSSTFLTIPVSVP